MTSGPYRNNVFDEQIDILYRTFKVGVIGAWTAALVVLYTLVAMGDLALWKALLWGGFISIVVFFHLLLGVLYWRQSASARDRRAWARMFIVASGLEGLWWGCAPFVLASSDRYDGQILTNSLALIIATGAVPAFASYLPAFLAIFLPISLISAAGHLTLGGILHIPVAGLIAIFLVTVLVLGRRANSNLTEMIGLRIEKEALIDDLQKKKEQAEEASLSKSRFLASASHDLRQPVHALGMFVGALSNHPMTGGMQRLVAQIEGSVQAIEGLFNSLLDISRLDAGAVAPQLQSFPIGPFLKRLCADYIADAEAKNLTLTLCPCSAWVSSDPLLLEQILRNLISNAVRYTDHGRILIGCRRRRRISIEVWDTGRGIPSDENDRIFDEFYQIGNPERDRRQGLGLGLAIVKRLTVLLDHPLEFRSTPANGSVFRISLRVAKPRQKIDFGSAVDTIPHSLSTATIVVIDDDGAVLESMRCVLSSWGAQVIAARSGSEATQRVAGGAERPDMILCDYRLAGGESGIDVIHRLQEFLGFPVPAVIITGDTASDRVKLAHESGFAILYKPVTYGKLRALIGNILRASRMAGDV